MDGMNNSSKTKLLRIAIIILILASFVGGFKFLTKTRFLGISYFNQAQESANKAIQLRKEAALIPIDADNSEKQSTELKFRSKEDAVKYANLKDKSDKLIDLSFLQTLSGSSEGVKQMLILCCFMTFISLITSIIGKLVDYRQSEAFRKKRRLDHDKVDL